ncbi:MAG: HAD family hydrolase [Chloroflexi bacterium]|nr:HAD family hydrolase [Chloroflexota bacterium]
MTLDLNRIQALCFDVDGTLSDTDDLYAQKAARFLPRFLFKNPERTARRFVMWMEAPGNALLGAADAFGVDDEIFALFRWISRRRKFTPKKFLLIPGVDETLKRLRGRYPLAVVSARDENGTMSFLEQFDLTGLFETVITGLSTRRAKPYPDPILLAARRMGVCPEACLMIGDTSVDIRAGKSAGAQTVGVLCGFGEEAELKRAGADLILTDTTKLLDVLK